MQMDGANFKEDAAAADLRDTVFEFYEEVDAIFDFRGRHRQTPTASSLSSLDPGAKGSNNAKEEDSGTDEDSSDSASASDGEEGEEAHEDSNGQMGGKGKSEGGSAEDHELQNAVMFFNLNDKAHFTTMEQLDVIDYFNGNKRVPFTCMAMSKAENADRRVDWLRESIFSA
ncbi:hypothetical protein CF327_g6835 [Tilletia walkeri]|nr:hypothetical protein CF327_g6835 [Tilletia walkeri]